MVQVAICDKQAGKYIEELLADEEQEFSLHHFASTGEILESEIPFDLILLDGTKLREAAGKSREPLLIKSGTGYIRLEREKILYVESSGRKLIIHTAEKEWECYGRISDWEESLGEAFYRCHRGYLVNLKAVEGYDGSSISIKGGGEIFLSRQKYRGFVERYEKYKGQDQKAGKENPC